MISILAICFVYSVGDVDGVLPIARISRPKIQIGNAYKGEIIAKLFYFQGDCPHDGEMQKYFDYKVNFLVNQAFKPNQISTFSGQLIFNEEEENTPKVNSTCYQPFIYAQNETEYSHVYYCEVDVQDVCYDYTVKSLLLKQ